MIHKGFDITGRTCLVTGGTSGIGRSVALALAEAGANVVTGSSSADKVAGMKKELGDRHVVTQLDVSNDKSVANAVKLAVDRFGRLDDVINAAGVIMRKPSLDMSTEEFERIVRINL